MNTFRTTLKGTYYLDGYSTSYTPRGKVSKITGKVTFAVPHSSTPEIWLRQTSSGIDTTIDNSNRHWYDPYDKAFKIISVSKEGFTFELYYWDVEYIDSIGRTDSYKDIPNVNSGLTLDYTLVGTLPPQEDSYTFAGSTTLSNAVYYGTTTINSGVTLTIPAGNEVHFSDVVNGASGAHIKVYGNMVMEPDTDINDVQLTVYDGGNWKLKTEILPSCPTKI